ncbi:hypothetical protein BDN72DRAFT_854769 [Pluteus cervinus]|uniref:Uncharacterized protein n=1 Tax=Pluteus cervinus TaxID=181527 RepID=A0ACD3B6T3_9AGAR|nr:hypothetical protein BDN72DRAFT_854769 [Pluteus cervinus]
MESPESTPWRDSIRQAKDYDLALCSRLTGELESLLLFAALFSAIVTAFAVGSYQWLQPNSPNPSPVPHSLAVQINFFWFVSLTISLSVGSIAILCLQWVRQYQGWPSEMTDSGTMALRRQVFEGFIRWRVPDIIVALPMILQLALGFFGVGLIRLLWSLNRTVAISVSFVFLLSVSFVIGTTIAPVLQWMFEGRTPSHSWWNYQCPYQSPQAWLVYLVAWMFSFGRLKLYRSWGEYNRSLFDLRCERLPDYESRLFTAELDWLDDKFPVDSRVVATRAEALQKLHFKVAQSAVVKLLENLKTDPKIVEAVCHFGGDPDETEERNFKRLKLWYLWGQTQIHPSLDATYMEARIGFMSERPMEKIDFPGFPHLYHMDVHRLVQDKYLVPRFLCCLTNEISAKRLRKDTSKEMWSIVGQLLEYSIRHAYTAYLPDLGVLFTTLLTELKENDPCVYPHQSSALTKPPEPPETMPDWHVSSMETVNDMLTGLHFFFPSRSIWRKCDLGRPNTEHMGSLLELVEFLDEKVKQTLGSPQGPPHTRLSTSSPPAVTTTVHQTGQPAHHKDKKDPGTPRRQGTRTRSMRQIRPKGPDPEMACRHAEVGLDVRQLVVQRKKGEDWDTLIHVLNMWMPKERLLVPAGGYQSLVHLQQATESVCEACT